jgi:hypothetical protein
MNDAAQRYADLLQVLADSKISDQEVAVLAEKWNITKGEVLEYIARIYAVNSTEIDEDPVIKLLMAWGLTKDQAQKYVDFTRALADEKIDDKEIEDLMLKWNMTRAEVLDYAKQVQTGTTFSTTWDDPGKDAQNSWLNALSALNAYIAALTTMTPQVPASVTPTTPSVAPTPINSFGGDEQTRISEMRRLEELYSPTTGITSGSTFDPGSFRMRDNAGMTVNVTVQGNVQTEQDLADAIRQRILLEQQSGKPILFVGGL